MRLAKWMLPGLFDLEWVNDAIQVGDQANSVGFFVQQRWNSMGLDLYAGVRRYEVERPDVDLKPLNVLALGAIFTF